MADRLEIQLIADVQRWNSQVASAAGVTGTYDEAIKRLTNGAIQLNSANKLVDTSTRRFVRTTALATAAQKQLESAGLRSVAQIREEIAQKRTLITVLAAEEIPARARLQAQIEQLQLEMGGLASSTRQAEQALFGMGFIIDDARQFTVDWSAGLRAVSNNIQPLIQSVSRMEGGVKGLLSALKGPAGIIIAFNTLALILAFVAEKFTQANKKAKDAINIYDELATAAGGSKAVAAWAALDNALAVVNEKLDAGTGVPGRLMFLQSELEKVQSKVRETAGPFLELTNLLATLKAETGVDLYSVFFPADKPDPGSSIKDVDDTAKEFTLTIEELRTEQDALRESIILTTQGFRDEELAIAIENQRLEDQLRLLEGIQNIRLGILGQPGIDALGSPQPLAPRPPGPDLTEEDAEANLEASIEKYQEQQERKGKIDEAAARDSERMAARISAALGSGMANAAGSFAQSVGGIIAGSESMSGAFNVLLVGLADVAIRVGKIAVATGFAVAGIKKALQSLNPAVAIAAGFALIAIGSAVKGALRGAASGGGGAGPAYGSGPYGGSGFSSYGNRGLGTAGLPSNAPGGVYVPSYERGPSFGVGGRALNAPVLAGASSGMGIHVTFDEPVVTGDKMKLAIKSYEVRLRR